MRVILKSINQHASCLFVCRSSPCSLKSRFEGLVVKEDFLLCHALSSLLLGVSRKLWSQPLPNKSAIRDVFYHSLSAQNLNKT